MHHQRGPSSTLNRLHLASSACLLCPQDVTRPWMMFRSGPNRRIEYGHLAASQLKNHPTSSRYWLNNPYKLQLPNEPTDKLERERHSRRIASTRSAVTSVAEWVSTSDGVPSRQREYPAPGGDNG